MKHEEHIGWMYPCEFPTHYWSLSVLMSDAAIVARRYDDDDCSCACGKNCKPIKVRLTVEEIK